MMDFMTSPIILIFIMQMSTVQGLDMPVIDATVIVIPVTLLAIKDNNIVTNLSNKRKDQ